VSEQNSNQQEQNVTKRSGNSRQRPPSSNPLGNSPLLGSSLRPELPTFNPLEDTSVSPPLTQQPPSARMNEPPAASLLYNTPAPPEYVLRPFEDRHDRQTIYIDCRKAGALDALTKLVARGNKTDFFEEMVNDILAKYADVLQANGEMVQILEQKYRKKHNL